LSEKITKVGSCNTLEQRLTEVILCFPKVTLMALRSTGDEESLANPELDSSHQEQLRSLLMELKEPGLESARLKDILEQMQCLLEGTS
jgi:hypothetical protein